MVPHVRQISHGDKSVEIKKDRDEALLQEEVLVYVAEQNGLGGSETM